MTYSLAYAVNFDHQDNIALRYARAAAANDRLSFASYDQWTRYEPAPSVQYAHTLYGSPLYLWRDTNHSQAEILHLIGILSTGNPPPNAAYGLPTGLNMNGARFDLRLQADKLWLGPDSQLCILLQWFDPEALNGRGAHVNYLVRPADGVSIDEQMGFTPAHARTGGQQSIAQWYDVSIQMELDDAATPQREDALSLIPISGRPDKVAAGVYGEAYDVSRLWDTSKTQLVSVMLVAAHGQIVPSPEPMAHPQGYSGVVYCSKFEIRLPD